VVVAEDLGAIRWRIDVDTTDLGRAESAMDKTGEVADRSGKRVVDSSKKIEKGYKDVGTAANLALKAVTALAAGISVQQAVKYADAWKQVNNQLRQVTASESQLQAVRAQLLSISKSTNAELGNTVNLYSELFRATRDLGTSQQTVAGVTKTINNLFKAGGKSAAETAGAVRQLAQGLASGALRGDEFNSVAEGAPRILDALAKHLNKSRGELREFAAEGGITAQIMVDALAAYSEEAQRAADMTEETFGQKMVNAKTNVTEFVGGMESATGVVGTLGDAIEGFTEHLDTAAKLAGAVALVMAGRLAASAIAAGNSFLYANTQAMAYQATLARMAGVSATAAASQTALRGVMALFGGPAGVAVLAAGGALYLATSLETVEERANRAKVALASLSEEQLKNAIDAMRIERDSAEATIFRMEQNSKGYAAHERAIAIQKKRLEEINSRLEEYGLRLSNLTNGIEENTEVTEEGATATSKLTEEQEKAAEAIAKANQSIAEQIAATRTETHLVQMSGKQRAIAEALIKATSEATKANTYLTGEQTQAIVESTGALYDQQAAIEATTQAEKDAAEQAKKTAADMAAAQKKHLEAVAESHRDAAQRSADEWRDFRNTMSDGFADLMMQGESAAEAIGKSFERMFYKIVGDMALSGFATMLSGKGFSFAGAGGAGGLESVFTNAGSGGSILSMLGAGKYLAKVATGGQGVITNAEFEQLMGGKSTSTGFNVTDLKNIGLSIGAGIAGSWAGTKVGESLFGKEANSSWGATAGGAVGAMYGPLGAFIGSALGGMVDAAFGGDGKLRQNAGFLASPAPGLKDEYNAGSHTFASGLKVTLFARRTDPSAARDIADVFDQVDRSFVDLVKELGGEIDMRGKSLRGLDEEANAGSYGNLFGTGGNGTTQGDIAAQLASYLNQLAGNVTGLDQALIDSVKSAGSAEEALALLTQAVIDKEAADKKEKESAEAATKALNEKIRLQDEYDELTMTSAELLQKQRNALEESNRAMFDQVVAAREAKDAAERLAEAERRTADERASLMQRLNELTMTSAELWARQRNAVGEANRALFDQITIAEGLKRKAQQRVDDAESGLSAAMTGVSNAMSAVSRAVQFERNQITKAYTESSRVIQEGLDKLRSLSSALKSSLDTIGFGPSRPDAQAQMRAVLAAARSGVLPDVAEIQPALKALSEPSEGLFSSFIDYQRDFIRTSNDISELADLADKQITKQEGELDVLKNGFDAEMSRLDSALDYAQAQLDALNGIDTSILSLASALSRLGVSVNTAKGAKDEKAAAEEAAQKAPVREYTPYTAEQIREYATAKSLYTVHDLYAAAVEKNADPYAVGAALGYTAAETLAKLQAAHIPGFAEGGDHAGGLRWVGEEGVELEYTGPSRITSNNDVRSMLRSDDIVTVLEKVERKLDEILRETRDDQRNTKATADLMNQWEAIGIPLREEEA
jgi:tape measure domain-containing protein